MQNYHDLLIEATEKLIDLSDKSEFKNEFLFRAPPILWFGNNSNNKEKILTLGANPSREEFLAEDKKKTIIRIKKGESPKYLINAKKRFQLLRPNEKWNNIITNQSLRDKIIDSYNNYFIKKPYKWFGKEKKHHEFSYNVEGFVNCFESSFYNGENKFQSIHIDLFPFATVSDFKSILKESEKHIFKDNWTNDFLNKLIDEINPKKIIVFGRTNLEYFIKLLGISNIGKEFHFTAITENGKKSVASYWSFKYRNISIIGLSVNLGNPVGFTKLTLNQFGNKIHNHVKNDE